MAISRATVSMLDTARIERHPGDAPRPSLPVTRYSVRAPERMLTQRRGNLLEAAQEMMVQADDLNDDDVRVFPVLGKGLHHGTKQGLWQPGRAIERLLDGQPP